MSVDVENPKWLRMLAVAALILWSVSLALPSYLQLVEYLPGATIAESDQSVTSGIGVLISGWLVPLSEVFKPTPERLPSGAQSLFPASDLGALLARFAWYANPLWAWNVGRMLRGKSAHLLAAIVSVVLALSALAPVYIGLGDDHGVNSAAIPLVGAYVWAAAVIVPALTVALSTVRWLASN